MKEFLRCKDCKHDKGKCVGASRRGGHKNCFEKKIMTNGDRIRAMSDEELALFLHEEYCPSEHRDGVCDEDCKNCWLRYLRKPAEVQGDV